MSGLNARISRVWMKVGRDLLPFADEHTGDLPWSRLFRLSLFQLSCGMSTVLLIGTLNRVMIVELGVSAGLVALMVALPLVFAPLRALIGFRSDTYRSVLGWRRVPYFWLGSVIQFGGLAMMPFALLILSGDTWAPPWVAQVCTAIAFLMVGAGLHTTQTVGLALATDLVPERAQPNVVALLSMMLLAGMVVAAIGFGLLLSDFSQLRLIQLIQGVAAATLVLNFIAVWKQEALDPSRTTGLGQHEPGFIESFHLLRREGPWNRRLAAVGLGTAGFAMQDVLLEPYGGQVLGLGVGATTGLTALMAGGGVLGFILAARWLSAGRDPYRICGYGALTGIGGFALVIFAGAAGSTFLFAAGTALIGLGAGFFAHATLTACMRAAPPDRVGLALGLWGAVQATCAGVAIAFGGALRDGVTALAEAGFLGTGLEGPVTGYVTVYAFEIALLFATIAAVGPLVARLRNPVPIRTGVADPASIRP
ncbi:PucC family protein [Roseomonas fluvialis]|uniref:MFS transporter n=1 Tax=Roseomonas fluvialis TaxID=1750527 RepID=A0ABM7Y376_9PROT|nr:PucC family protein [Roseomonas fluvialis]BDG72275.1 MFS transporter [Roseomonas fluvialis]